MTLRTKAITQKITTTSPCSKQICFRPKMDSYKIVAARMYDGGRRKRRKEVPLRQPGMHTYPKSTE